MSCENVPPPAETPGIKELMGIYSCSDNTWEDNLSHFYAVAHVLWHLTAEEIPAEWGYGHAEIDDSGWWRNNDTYTIMVAGLYDDGVVTDDDLLAFGGWLVKVDADFRSRGEGDY